MVFAEFDGKIFASVGVEAAPVADAVDAGQSDAKELLARCARIRDAQRVAEAGVEFLITSLNARSSTAKSPGEATKT